MMADEYIRRAEALEITTRTCGDYAAAFAEIRKLPAADVAPVVHGKWVHSRYDRSSGQFDVVKCSRCGIEAYAMAYHVRDGNYCPRCGARMDGGNEGNESAADWGSCFRYAAADSVSSVRCGNAGGRGGEIREEAP